MRPIIYALMLVVATLAGCNSDTTHGVVEGTVTVDGAPLKEGLIRFTPKGGDTATADATIADGVFTVRVPIGEKQVSVNSPKVVGQRKAYETADSPMVDVIEEAIPARYNSNTELTMNVKPGKQPAKFELQTEK
jgi:hypothetical protein